MHNSGPAVSADPYNETFHYVQGDKINVILRNEVTKNLNYELRI